MEMIKFYRLVLYMYVSCADKHLLCGSRKYQFRESLEIPTERGGYKDQNFVGKYEPKLEFPEIFFFFFGGGGGGQTKTSSMEGVWIFSGCTHLLDRSCQTAIQTCCD